MMESKIFEIDGVYLKLVSLKSTYLLSDSVT